MTTTLSAADIQARLDRSPFCAFLGLRATEADGEAGRLVMTMPMRPEIERGFVPGQYHGGAIATLIDVAGDFAIALSVGDAVPTINLRVDYLRPAGGAALTAIALVRRAGRTVGVVDIDVTDGEGRLVAVGRGCYSTKAG